MKEKEGNTIRKAVINNAINYIFDHIDEEITVDDVANYCSYSKYHLTRMFKEDMNEALYQFIKRVRLERSAWRLKVEKESSFSNGITLDELEDAGKRITIEHLESFTAIYERKKGNYHNLPKEWCAFIEKYSYLATEDTLYIECTIDDPSITDEKFSVKQTGIRVVSVVFYEICYS